MVLVVGFALCMGVLVATLAFATAWSRRTVTNGPRLSDDPRHGALRRGQEAEEAYGPATRSGADQVREVA